MLNKKHGFNKWFLLIILGMHYFVGYGIYLVIDQHEPLTLLILGIAFIFFILLEISFLGSYAEINSDYLKIKRSFFLKPSVIKWNDISGMTFRQDSSGGLVLGIKQKGTDRIAVVNRLFSKHQQMIKEILEHFPSDVFVDPEVYKKLEGKNLLIYVLILIAVFFTLYIFSRLSFGLPLF